jgi:hypothetical protein
MSYLAVFCLCVEDFPFAAAFFAWWFFALDAPPFFAPVPVLGLSARPFSAADAPFFFVAARDAGS